MNPNYDFEKLRFLVVDDNKYMRTLVKAILHSFRIKTVDEAEDAIMAFKLLKSFPIDVVITDFNMPILDGIEFVKMVRTSKDSVNPYIPIIMLTGFSELSKIVLARDSGVNAFLTKPVSANAVYSKIVYLIENPQNFIKCKTFVGPDRRRKDSGPPEGVEDRRADSLEPVL